MTSFWLDRTDGRFMGQLRAVRARPSRFPKTMTTAFSSGSMLLSGISQHKRQSYLPGHQGGYPSTTQLLPPYLKALASALEGLCVTTQEY